MRHPYLKHKTIYMRFVITSGMGVSETDANEFLSQMIDLYVNRDKEYITFDFKGVIYMTSRFIDKSIVEFVKLNYKDYSDKLFRIANLEKKYRTIFDTELQRYRNELSMSINETTFNSLEEVENFANHIEHLAIDQNNTIMHDLEYLNIFYKKGTSIFCLWAEINKAAEKFNSSLNSIIKKANQIQYEKNVSLIIETSKICSKHENE